MNQEINILVTGDFYGGNRIENLIKSEKYADIFNDFMHYSQHADLAITNLESALTLNDKPITKTGPAIKALPITINALKHADFNILTLANNHIMDFGKTGLMDTLALCEINNIRILGAGLNREDASNTLFKQVKGKTLAFINFAENEWSTTNGDEAGANPLNPVSNFYAIQHAKKQADFVFVIVHGGHEMFELPSPRMKETYRFFIDAGASAVIGHHTHCYSGYEIYKSCPIFYSLGNFVFDSVSKQNQEWYRGFAVGFNIKNNVLAYEIIPYKQCDEKPGVFLLNEDEKRQFTQRLNELSLIIQDDIILKEKFQIFCNKAASIGYNVLLEPHSNRMINYLQRKGFLPSFLSKRKKLIYENLIRCEAHRDVVLEILKK